MAEASDHFNRNCKLRGAIKSPELLRRTKDTAAAVDPALKQSLLLCDLTFMHCLESDTAVPDAEQLFGCCRDIVTETTAPPNTGGDCFVAALPPFTVRLFAFDFMDLLALGRQRLLG